MQHARGIDVEVLCSTTRFGEEVGIVGAPEELGAWHTSRAVRLTTDSANFPRWSRRLWGIAGGSEFKLVILGGAASGRDATWEPLAGNRRWPDSAARNGVLSMVFGEAGEAFEWRTSAPRRFTRSSSTLLALPLGSRPRPAAVARGPSGGSPTPRRRMRERLLAASCYGNLQDHYHLEPQVLGEGSFGVVCRARSKNLAKSETCAVKTVVKATIENVDDFAQEIELTRAMDHPNIVRLFNSYEDERSVHLVMEICDGGELFDRIDAAGHLTEHQAAVLARQMLRALSYLHKELVMHRDLKPENFMFISPGPVESVPLKLIDFGLSARFEPGVPVEAAVGTPLYVAPEVLVGEYGPQCDLWSFGAILYTLLCGRPPFLARSDKEVLAKVKACRYSFQDRVWKTVSRDAKHLIGKLLEASPAARLTAQEGLEHSWLRLADMENTDVGHHTKLDSVVQNLKAWRCDHIFKRAAMIAVAGQLSESQIHELRDHFVGLDCNGDGHLTLQELRDGMEKTGICSAEDLENILNVHTADPDGYVCYTEFLSAALDRRTFARQELCWHAFRSFDTDRDGKITCEEIKQVLGCELLKHFPDTKIAADLLGDSDVNGDGAVDFDEFMCMMSSTSPTYVECA